MNSQGRELLDFYFSGPRDILEDTNEAIEMGLEGIVAHINAYEGDLPDDVGILSLEEEARLILEFAHDYKSLREEKKAAR